MPRPRPQAPILALPLVVVGSLLAASCGSSGGESKAGGSERSSLGVVDVTNTLRSANIPFRVGRTSGTGGLGTTTLIEGGPDARGQELFKIVVFKNVRDADAYRQNFEFAADGVAETHADDRPPTLVSLVKFYKNVEFVWFRRQGADRPPQWHAVDQALGQLVT